MDSQLKTTEQLIRIEATLDVLLTLEKERRMHELRMRENDPGIPFERAVFEIDRLLEKAVAAARDRTRLGQT